MKKLLLLLILITSKISFSQDQFFSSPTVPSNWSAQNGTLNISTLHYKKGTQSLKWTSTAGDQLTVDNLLSSGLNSGEVMGFSTNTFLIWVYNTQASATDSILFEFYGTNNQVEYQFATKINFTGWRALTLSYKFDMTGTKTTPNLNKLVITAPNFPTELFFDYIDYTKSRLLSKAPDHQLPQVVHYNNVPNHWYNQMIYEALPQFIPVSTPTASEINEFNIIKSKYDSLILGTPPSAGNVSNAVNDFNQLNITVDANGNITGKPLFGATHGSSENYESVEAFLHVLARDYKHNNTQSSHDQFMLTIRHMLDQGFAFGSMVESISHIGYGFRTTPYAVHLMKDELIAEGIWDEAREMIEWYVALESIWDTTAEFSNMDEGNTRSIQKLGAALYKPTIDEAVQYLKGYKAYLENWLTVRHRFGIGIKPDYSAHHHKIHYPGYSHHALNNVGQCVHLLSYGPMYFIDSSSQDVLKNCLLTTRTTLGHDEISRGLSGRNPFTYPKISNALLKSGHALNDSQLLAIYNRLYSGNEGNITPESLPTGFWQYNYMPAAAYRQGNWVADVKGLNNNFFGTEIYSNRNRYGRYQSYGAVEILYDGGMNASGYTSNGWNWNVVPGATTIHLPWTQLVAEQSRADEKTSKTFTGALRLKTSSPIYSESNLEGQYGVFGMDFQQMQPTWAQDHDSSFIFKKSVFCMEGKVICLGSNISNTNANATATNLFQGAISSPQDIISVNGTTVSSTNYNNSLSGNTDNWLLDSYGTGFYIQSGDDIEIRRENQSTPNHTGSGTSSGNFSSAWIDHGTSPVNASYEFVIIPETNSAAMNSFSPTSFYSVSQQNDKAHILTHSSTGITGYVIFDPNTTLTTPGIISSVDLPVLIMEQPIGQSVQLSLTDPNIMFVNDTSQYTSMVLVVNGEWQLSNATSGISLGGISAGTTTLNVDFKDGLPEDVLLIPSNCTPTFSTSNQSACDSTVWNGTSYSTSGTYTWVGTNSNGCDSTATLNLTITSATYSTTNETECNSFVWNGNTYSSSGTYTWTGTNTNGCDSIATLNLIISGSTYSNTVESTCDSLNWNGTSYSTSGTYTWTGVNAAGCDSIATLDLTVFPDPNTSIVDNNGTLEAADLMDGYQWIDCSTNSILAGEVSQSYTPTAGGSYACIVSLNGCSDTTDCVVSTIGLNPLNASGIKIISLENEIKIITPSSTSLEVFIYSADGKLINSSKSEDSDQIIIDVSEASRGMYFIVLNSSDFGASYKLLR